MFKQCALWLAFKLLSWATPPVQPDPLATVVADAYLTLGLPAADYRGTYNVAKTGKLGDLLVLIADALNGDHSFTTIDDITAVFTKLQE